MRPNSYIGPCKLCGVTVNPNEGQIKKDPVTDRWLTYHLDGACPTAAQPVRQQAVTSTDSAVDRVIELMTAKFTSLVPDLVADNLVKLSRVAEIKVGEAPPVKIETAHNALPDVVCTVVAGDNPYLVGPAGSGKTTLAEQVATVLQRAFYLESRVTSEFKLLGFIDAAGHVVRTQFREAYEHGGVFLLDEVDASDPDALTAFNSALANGMCPFPDGMIRKHPDFAAIAAGNTYGRGADRQYVGRNQLDAATLDRFCILEVDYDEMLELELSGNVEWARYVQKVRKAVELEKVRHVVSPRASIMGAKLLAAGMEWELVEERRVWKGLDAAQRARVVSRMGSM